MTQTTHIANCTCKFCRPRTTTGFDMLCGSLALAAIAVIVIISWDKVGSWPTIIAAVIFWRAAVWITQTYRGQVCAKGTCYDVARRRMREECND